MNATSISRSSARASERERQAPTPDATDRRRISLKFDGVCSTRSVEIDSSESGADATTPIEHEIGRVAEPMC